MPKIEPKRLAVLVSGGGTNMQSIMDAADSGIINGKVVAVISSNANAYALQRAEKAGIESFVCAVSDFGTREKRDERIKEILKNCKADYVLLAGYLGIIPSSIVDEFPYRIVNIHPALLPAYGGKNYFGINVHRAVIAAKESYSGATVHFVDSGTDTGLIIAQEKLPVEACDTPETLQDKILEKIEHRLFVRVVKDLCNNKVFVKDNKVIYEK